MKSVLRPSPGTEQADFSETLKLLKDHFEPVEIFGLPEPVPSGFEHINASISLESIARTFPKEHNREPESSRLLRPSSTIGGNQRRKLSAVMQRPINIFEWSAARQKTDISIPCSELPVSGVTWHECMRFAKCLTIADPEFDYRLPAVSELQDFDKKAEDSSTGIEYKELHEWCCPLPEKPSLSEEASGPRKEMKPIYCRGALQGKVLQRLPWSVPSGYLASIGFRLVRTEKEKAW